MVGIHGPGWSVGGLNLFLSGSSVLIYFPDHPPRSTEMNPPTVSIVNDIDYQ